MCIILSCEPHLGLWRILPAHLGLRKILLASFKIEDFASNFKRERRKLETSSK